MMISRLTVLFLVIPFLSLFGILSNAMEHQKNLIDDGKPLVFLDENGELHSETYDEFRPLRETKVDDLLRKLTEFHVKYKSFTKNTILHGNLDLSGRLKNLDEFQKEEILSLITPLNWLYRLVLSQNNLSEISADFSQLKHLKEVDFSQNQLTSVPISIWTLTSLEELDLSENKLKGVHDLETGLGIGSLTHLRVLNLFENQLTILPDQIGELKNLTELHLLVNHLEKLTPRIGDLINLTELNLRHNNLMDLPPEIWQLTSLKMLSLGFNDLSCLHPQVGKLKDLTHLDLTYNKLTSLPQSIEFLTNIQTLDLEHNEGLLLHGESQHSWGRREIYQHFQGAVILSPYLPDIMDVSTTKEEVYQALDAQPLRVNRQMIKQMRLPELTFEHEFDGTEIMREFCKLLSTLNFIDESKSNYLSYLLLAQDLDKEIREDYGSDIDKMSNPQKIFRFILPRITGYFKVLFQMSMEDSEKYEWRQMHEENKSDLKKTLTYLIQKLNTIEDPDQKALLFTQFVHGMLHCPTGQKEGIDTVVLSLLDQELTGLDLDRVVSMIVSINKNACFKKTILLKGWNHPHNVHLISAYEEKLRDELGINSSLGLYHERVGTLEFQGFDPFSGNVNNVLKVFYELMTPQCIVGWIMDKVQSREDLIRRQTIAQYEKQLEGSQRMPLLENYQKKLESLEKQLLKEDLPASEQAVLKQQIHFLEKQVLTLQQKIPQLSTSDQTALLTEIKKRKVEDRLAYKARPITTGDILNYLISMEVIFTDNPIWIQNHGNWWQNYFTADPVYDELCVLTPLGVKNLLLHMGVLMES